MGGGEATTKHGRNQKCPCGSGRKSKKCCGLAFQRPKVAAISPVPRYAPSSVAPGKPPLDGRNWLMRVDSESKLDLDLILKAMQDEELSARRIGSDVYIDWEMLRPRMPFGPASHAAERFLPILNGMLAIRFPAFRGLKLKSILGVSDDGQWMPITWTSFNLNTGGHVEQAKAYLNGGGPTVSSLYRLATTDAAVAEALLYFGRGNEPFFDLYKAFEVVRDTLGGEERLETLGLARAECERFTRSANDPGISGVFARHSQKPSTPVANPMNEIQARDFIRDLLQRWINYLSSSARADRGNSPLRED